MQAAPPSPEQQWENMMNRVAERANGIPDTRALKIDLQEGLVFLQRLKDQMVSTRDEEIKVWKTKAGDQEKMLKLVEVRVRELEVRIKELESKYEVQPKRPAPKLVPVPGDPEGRLISEDALPQLGKREEKK